MFGTSSRVNGADAYQLLVATCCRCGCRARVDARGTRTVLRYHGYVFRFEFDAVRQSGRTVRPEQLSTQEAQNFDLKKNHSQKQKHFIET